MKTLVPLIQSLSTEEQKEVLKFLNQKNQRGDVKNILLFTSICKGRIGNLEEIIYAKPSKNAFYALCNRLQENIIEVVASNSFSGETSEEMTCLKWLLSSRIFFEKQLYKLGFKLLKRAEKLAKEYELYSILNEVYHTKIQYASQQKNISLDLLFRDANQNLTHFKKEFQFNMAYAEITLSLKKNPLQSSKNLIENTFLKFNIPTEENLSYKSLFQLFNIISAEAKQQSNYYKISEYASNLFNIVKEKSHLSQKHTFYHLHILWLMANIYFRTKHFEESLLLVNQLHDRCKETKYEELFKEDIVLLKSLNLIYSSKLDAAIDILESVNKNSPNLKLSLAVGYILKENYEVAYKILRSLTHSDNWYEKKLDLLWVIKKNLINLIVLIEMDKVDLAYLQLNSFQQRFGKRLKKLGEERIIDFLKFIKLYYDKPEENTSVKFKEKLEDTFAISNNLQIDILMLGFYAWVKSKVYKENFYATFLSTIHKKTLSITTKGF